jgi:hypothetical protein
MDPMFDSLNPASPCNDPDALMDAFLEHVISRDAYLTAVKSYFNNQLPSPVSLSFEDLGIGEDTPCETKCLAFSFGDAPDNSDLIVQVLPLRTKDRYSIQLMQALRKLFLADKVCFSKGKNKEGEDEVYITAKRNETTIVWANWTHKYP